MMMPLLYQRSQSGVNAEKTVDTAKLGSRENGRRRKSVSVKKGQGIRKGQGISLMVRAMIPMMILTLVFMPGCDPTDGSKAGLFGGLLLGGAFTMYQVTANHSTATASTPEVGEQPVETLKGLAASFKARNVDEALLRFSPHVRESYRAILTDMKERLPLIADELTQGNPAMGFKGTHFCEVLVTRTEADGIISYPVTFMKEADGEWRIAGL